MRWQPLGLALGLVLGAGHVAAADDGTVSPDRPDVTDSTHTVPPDAVQTETGIQYTRARQAGRPAQQFLDVPGTLWVGLGDRIEARLPVDPVVQLRDASDAGHGTVGLGLKYRHAVVLIAHPSDPLGGFVVFFGLFYYWVILSRRYRTLGPYDDLMIEDPVSRQTPFLHLRGGSGAARVPGARSPCLTFRTR